MVSLCLSLPAALGMAAVLSAPIFAHAEDSDRKPCIEDAMLVFNASGSMAGNVNQGIATITPRIDAVRSALAKVLPSITRLRRVGLITYGPGPYQQCNVQLNLKPTPNAGDLIMREVNALTPAGKTPLTAAVGQAARVLDYRAKPGRDHSCLPMARRPAADRPATSASRSTRKRTISPFMSLVSA